MQTIKFRQPVTRNHRFVAWHYWGYLEDAIDSFVTPITSNDGEIKASYQFTGLHDKQGKEIYDGDVVTNFWHDITGKDIGGIWVVKYGEHSVQGDDYYSNTAIGFFYKNIKTEEEYNIIELPTDNGMFKVIGNIYENPELIK